MHNKALEAILADAERRLGQAKAAEWGRAARGEAGDDWTQVLDDLDLRLGLPAEQLVDLTDLWSTAPDDYCRGIAFGMLLALGGLTNFAGD